MYKITVAEPRNSLRIKHSLIWEGQRHITLEKIVSIKTKLPGKEKINLNYFYISFC